MTIIMKFSSKFHYRNMYPHIPDLIYIFIMNICISKDYFKMTLQIGICIDQSFHR